MVTSHPSATSSESLDALRAHALEIATHSLAPYSNVSGGAALLLSDGKWVAGVRLESATFPLTITALQAAYVAAVSAGRRDIVAAAIAGPVEAGAFEWLGATLEVNPEKAGPDAARFADSLPAPGERLQVALDAAPPASDQEGVALARAVAASAYAPFSDFPVGCVILYETSEGRAHLVPGVNVEHPDWTRGLCAERSAVVATRAFGPGTIRRMYLSCLKDTSGTPCGACRQILAETLPDTAMVIDRGGDEPERITPRDLLPRFFSGDRLRR